MSPNADAPRLLHLGCGLTAPAEWTNVDGSRNAALAQQPFLKKIVRALRLAPKSQLDIPWPTNVIVADLRKRLPFPANSFDGVYSSHLMEHLHREDAIKLLREAMRVLKPGGTIRTLVPDVRAMVDEYLGQKTYPGSRNDDDPARRLCHRLMMRGESAPRGGLLYSLYSARTDFHSHKWMYDADSLIKLMTEAGLNNCQSMPFHTSRIPHVDKVEQPHRFEGGVAVEGQK